MASTFCEPHPVRGGSRPDCRHNISIRTVYQLGNLFVSPVQKRGAQNRANSN